MTKICKNPFETHTATHSRPLCILKVPHPDPFSDLYFPLQSPAMVQALIIPIIYTNVLKTACLVVLEQKQRGCNSKGAQRAGLTPGKRIQSIRWSEPAKRTHGTVSFKKKKNNRFGLWQGGLSSLHTSASASAQSSSRSRCSRSVFSRLRLDERWTVAGTKAAVSTPGSDELTTHPPWLTRTEEVAVRVWRRPRAAITQSLLEEKRRRQPAHLAAVPG